MDRLVVTLVSSGMAAHQSGDLLTAERDLRRALELQPDEPNAMHFLGITIFAQNRPDEAWPLLDRSIRAAPGAVHFRMNYARVLRAARAYDKALIQVQHAVQLAPRDAGCYRLMGSILHHLERTDEAVAAYQSAIALAPNSLDIREDLAAALTHLGRLDEALAVLQEILQRDANRHRVRVHLGGVLIALGRIDDGLRSARDGLAKEPANPMGHATVLLASHYVTDDPAALFAEHRKIARIIEEQARSIAVKRPAKPANGRVRIAYLSPDFRNHAVAHFIEPILRHHDRTRFEVYAYADVLRPDAVTERIAASVDVWRPVYHLSHPALAQQIADDAIDILIDLAGHTAGNRAVVLAAKPARLQATYLGYPNTTALSAVDLRITDALTDPPGTAEAYNTERLIRPSPCFVAYQPAPEAQSLPVSEGPASRGEPFTFGSFNNIAKLSPLTLNLWADILAAAPQTRLVLKSSGAAGPSARQHVLQAFGDRSIAADRITFLERMASHADHLQAYRLMDLALDTYPYNGTTTTLEALWMGVPVLTLAGSTHASRVGKSLLTNLGLESFVAPNRAAYVARAISVATGGAAELNVLRSGLRSRLRHSTIMDHRGFVRRLESALLDNLQATAAGNK